MKRIMLHVRRGNYGDRDKEILMPDGYEKFFSENNLPATHFIEVWRDNDTGLIHKDQSPFSPCDGGVFFNELDCISLRITPIAIFKIRAK